MDNPPNLKRGMADIEPGVRLHYLEAGDGPATAVLLHGFPQTSHEWRTVLPRLAHSGLRVIAPDYRGAGWSSKPQSGYDKWTMAGDLHSLLCTHLGVTDRIILVGHDVGGILATAYAARYRDGVSHLAIVDAPIPGTTTFERMKGDPRGWHAAFHSARDVAEMLVMGRERAYLQHMIGVRIFDPSAIASEDFDTYVRAYEAPGAMRAAFELYRAFEQDATALRGAVSEGGKLQIPVLSVAGEMSGLASVMTEMLREIAEQVDSVTVPRSAHWVPEENPDAFVDALLAFVRKEAARRAHGTQ